MFFLFFAIIAEAIPPVHGPYEVQNAQVHVGGYVADGGKIQTAQVYWPTPKTPDEKFPFVVFMHGMTAGGAEVPIAYGPKLIEPLASFGYVIVAPESCRERYCNDFYKDGLHTVVACRNNTKIHKSLATADFSKLGVFGHSMGGAATVYVADNHDATYNFLGGVALHPSTRLGDGSKNVKVPLFYGTGSADTVVAPAGVIHSYNIDPTNPKTIFEIEGATHYEPTTPDKNRMTPYVNQFMECHVKSDTKACDYIYGTSADSLCHQKTIPITLCNSTKG